MRKEADYVIGSTKVAELLGLSRSQVNRLAAAGVLPAEKMLDRVWLFWRSDVDAYAETRKEST